MNKQLQSEIEWGWNCFFLTNKQRKKKKKDEAGWGVSYRDDDVLLQGAGRRVVPSFTQLQTKRCARPSPTAVRKVLYLIVPGNNRPQLLGMYSTYKYVRIRGQQGSRRGQAGSLNHIKTLFVSSASGHCFASGLLFLKLSTRPLHSSSLILCDHLLFLLDIPYSKQSLLFAGQIFSLRSTVFVVYNTQPPSALNLLSPSHRHSTANQTIFQN